MAFCEVKPEHLTWTVGMTVVMMKTGKSVDNIIKDIANKLPSNNMFMKATLVSKIPKYISQAMAQSIELGSAYGSKFMEIQEIRESFESENGYANVLEFIGVEPLTDKNKVEINWNGKSNTTSIDGEIFDGYYKDGMKDGMGILIFANGNKYEGEFKEGKYNGKGILTYSNGYKYEGNFFDSYYDGYGIEIFSNGDKYEGEFKNNKKHGKGVYYFADGDKYEGEFKDGKKHGKGVLTLLNSYESEGVFIELIREGNFIEGHIEGYGIDTFSNGEKYEGEFKNGDRNGHGILTRTDGFKYEGEFKDGDYNGQGILTFSNGNKYVGEFVNGNYEGYGVETYSKGDKYEGEYKNDKRHGKGILTRKDGYKYEGDFIDGNYDGYGIECFANGDKYEGEFKNNKRNGIGILTRGTNTIYQGDLVKVIKEGGFSEGVLEGYGVETFSNGEKYEGEFLNGLRHGKGILTYTNGDKYEGEFKDGIEDGQGILIYTEGYKYESKFIKGKHVDKGIVTYSGLKRNEEELENNFFNFIKLKFDNTIKINTTEKESVKNNNNYYIFFDVETTGLPKRYNAPASDLDNWPRLVQLAYIIFDKQGNRILEENFIIKPEGFSISEESIAIHNITNERAKKEGSELIYVLDDFKKHISQATYLVAHNIAFDEKVIESEFIRNGITNILPDKTKICTMMSTINFCKIDWNQKYKWPKLEELYFILFGEKFDNSHNALADIRATAKCFWKLVKLGEIKLDNVENNDISIFTWWDVVKHNPNKFTFYESEPKPLSLMKILSNKKEEKDFKYYTKDDWNELFLGISYNNNDENYLNDRELIKKIKSIDITNYDLDADLFGVDSIVFEDEIDLEIASNIKPIANLTNLKSIKYKYISFNNFNYLANLKNLEKLVFVFCKNFNLDTIAKLEKLKILDFYECHFNEFRANALHNQLDFIGRLKKLEYLIIKGCKGIHDLSPLKNHNSLKYIRLEGSNISNLEQIAFNYMLEDIDFSYNKLKEIECIVNLKNLKTIKLNNNMISDFTVLENLTNIKSLRISNNPIKNIDFAKKLINLEEFDIGKCEIESLSPLYNLNKLEMVICDENQFTDLEIDNFKKAKPDCYIGINRGHGYDYFESKFK
jgi:DNA polymerase III epsilon subunit-like protein